MHLFICFCVTDFVRKNSCKKEVNFFLSYMEEKLTLEKTIMGCYDPNKHFSSISDTYLETKCVLSGENATLNTQEAWPDSVPVKLACNLKNKTLNR